MKRREREFMIQKKKYIKASRFGKLIMSLNYSKWFTKLTKRKRKKLEKKWLRKNKRNVIV